MMTKEQRENIRVNLAKAPSAPRQVIMTLFDDLLKHTDEMDAALKAERDLSDALAAEVEAVKDLDLYDDADTIACIDALIARWKAARGKSE